MLVSMFCHADTGHLLANMSGLIIYGRKVFQERQANIIWKDPLPFLTLYLGSGIGGFLGVSVLSFWHERQWQTKLGRNRKALTQSMNWLWGASSSIPRSIADTFTYVTNWYSVANKFVYNAVPRIGASGAVYGIVGARVYTDLITNDNDATTRGSMSAIEALYLGTQIAVELAHCPLSLHSMDSFMTENVDHVAHAAGFFSGVLLAAVMERWSSWWSNHRRRQRHQ